MLYFIKNSKYLKIFMFFMLFCIIFTCFSKNYCIFAKENNNLENKDQINLIYNNETFKINIKNSNNINFIKKKYNKYKNINNIGIDNVIINLKKLDLNDQQILSYLFNDIYSQINLIISKIEKKPVDAEFIFINDRDFKITLEKSGIEINKQLLYEDIINFLYNNSKNNIVDNKIYIKYKIIEPIWTKELLVKATNLKYKYTTNFSSSGENRKHNICLALSKFNNLVIMPEQKISFNKITGSRSLKNGYKQAKIISNGKYVDGIGGGVCQASTAIYNAVLLSGLKINSVYSHSLTPSYVELGFDAMVNIGSSDLVFTNNTTLPIIIKTFTSNTEATIEIYGIKNDGIKYKKKYEILNIIPFKTNKIIPDINNEYSDKVNYIGEFYTIQSPKNGYTVRAVLQKFKNNILIDEIFLRNVTYSYLDGITIEGAKSRPNFDEIFKNDNLYNNYYYQ